MLKKILFTKESTLDLEKYQHFRNHLKFSEPQYRQLCRVCLQPQFSCYCQFIRKIRTPIKFVILIHPIEAKRRIATGRMAHLCLENSELILGQDYTGNSRVNEILGHPENQCMILYPGKNSLNLSTPNSPSMSLFAAGKNPVIFVIDGTWATARKTMFQSLNLKPLPKICFTPQRPSSFRVRKQPAPECFSTIEAIHYSIELLSSHMGRDQSQREHDHLLEVFNIMVEKQLEFIRLSQETPNPRAYRRPKNRIA